MEKRLPLAADAGHNFLMPADVNDDHAVKASDALAIINMLSTQNQLEAEEVDASLSDLFYDVNDDGRATASDAKYVINQLGLEPESTAAAEMLETDGQVRARIELGIRNNGEAECLGDYGSSTGSWARDDNTLFVSTATADGMYIQSPLENMTVLQHNGNSHLLEEGWKSFIDEFGDDVIPDATFSPTH